MGREVHPVAGTQGAGRRLALELQPGGAAQQHHPFGAVLVVPEAGRADLAGGDDALQHEAGRLQQGRDLFLRRVRLQSEEQIAGPRAGHGFSRAAAAA